MDGGAATEVTTLCPKTRQRSAENVVCTGEAWRQMRNKHWAEVRKYGAGWGAANEVGALADSADQDGKSRLSDERRMSSLPNKKKTF